MARDGLARFFVQYAAAAMTSGALFGSNTMWQPMAGVVATEAARSMRQKTASPSATSLVDSEWEKRKNPKLVSMPENMLSV